MSFDKSCGRLTLRLWTDGYPPRADISVDDKELPASFSVDDLVDLRYLIDRALEGNG